MRILICLFCHENLLRSFSRNDDFCIDSFKVSESLLIHDSPKWILRLFAKAQYDGVGWIRTSCGFYFIFLDTSPRINATLSMTKMV